MHRPHAYTTFLFMQGALALAMQMIFTASVVYQVTTVHLDPFQLVLVGTMLEATVFLFEVPTGIVADAYSRRWSIVIGLALIGLGFLIEGTVPRFDAILIAQLVWGIGYTFTSGATQAWISDEIGQARAGSAFLRGAQMENAGGLVGIAFGVALGSLAINLPIVVGGSMMIGLALLFAIVMTEHGFTPVPQEKRNSLQHMAGIFRKGIATVRKRPVLVTILATIAIHGTCEGYDRLWAAHMIEEVSLPMLGNFQPVVWLGAMRIVSALLGITAIQIAHRRLDTTSHRGIARALWVISAMLSLAVIAFALTGDFFVAASMYWVANVMRRLVIPIQYAWVNQQLDSSVRATVISMSSQADAFGQIAGGPAVGAIGSAISIRAAIATSGIILAPVLWLYAHTARQKQEVTT